MTWENFVIYNILGWKTHMLYQTCYILTIYCGSPFPIIVP